MKWKKTITTEQEYEIALARLSSILDSDPDSAEGLEAELLVTTTVSLVLNKKRPMSVEMVRKLSTFLGLSVNLLIQPYALVDKQEKINQ